VWYFSALHPLKRLFADILLKKKLAVASLWHLHVVLVDELLKFHLKFRCMSSSHGGHRDSSNVTPEHIKIKGKKQAVPRGGYYTEKSSALS